MESTNKKRTAVAAVATAAALALTGTVAWNMATDQTMLNELPKKDPGAYEVELKETFDPNDPWTNKDVWVKNIADNPVIVRIRLEEFYDLTYRDGTNYSAQEGYSQTPSSEGSSAIFTPDDGDNLADDHIANSATKLNEKVSLLFGDKVVTMAEYKAITDETEKEAVSWVVDTDGWCYYTKALLAGQDTPLLLDKATFEKEQFELTYDSPYNLDYKINVRLQAISADLEDFGSHIKDYQWTNIADRDENGNDVEDLRGRVIAQDERDDDFEIIDNTPITDDARDLVIAIHNAYTNPYKNNDDTIAVKVGDITELIAAIKDTNVHSILLTSDIDLSNYTIGIRKDFYIEMGDYKLTKASGSAMFKVYNGATLTVKNGIVNSGTSSFVYIPEDSGNAKLDITNVTITSSETGQTDSPIIAGKKSEIKLTKSNIISGALPALVLCDDVNIEINSCNLSSNTTTISNRSEDLGNNDSIVIKNSKITGYTGITLWTGCVLNASNTEFASYDFGYSIAEEGGHHAKEVTLTNCILSGSMGYYKASTSVLTMKDTQVKTANLGIAIRNGKVTLDNVTTVIEKDIYDEIQSPALVDTHYARNRDGVNYNHDALQIILNSYGAVNVNIIGGSYETKAPNAPSVYVYNGPDKGYNNTVNISNSTTFSDNADALHPATPYNKTEIQFVD